MWQSYFFLFKRLKNKVKCFIKQHFYKQHQAKILSKIIKILNIKRNEKKIKHSK